MAEKHDDALSDRLYEAALDDGLWDSTIQQYAESFGGVGVVILRPGFASPIISVSNGAREGAEIYNQGWWREDIILQTAQRLKLDQPGVVFDDDFLSAETKARHAYFQEFLRSYDVGSVATVVARPNDGDTIAVNVQRRYGLPAPDAKERERFISISRVLSRALAIRLRLGHAEAARYTLIQRLADFDCAAAVVDERGQIVELNQAFETMADEGLTVSNRRVQVGSTIAQQRFDTALHAAILGVSDGLPDAIMLPTKTSVFPLLARITPLRAQAADRFGTNMLRHGALILILHATHTAYPNLTRILIGFGLTPTQAKVALLVGSGHTAKSAAELLLVSEETVRSHLKGAFARLGVSRQADLIRLVARVSPFAR